MTKAPINLDAIRAERADALRSSAISSMRATVLETVDQLLSKYPVFYEEDPSGIELSKFLEEFIQAAFQASLQFAAINCEPLLIPEIYADASGRAAMRIAPDAYEMAASLEDAAPGSKDEVLF